MLGKTRKQPILWCPGFAKCVRKLAVQITLICSWGVCCCIFVNEDDNVHRHPELSLVWFWSAHWQLVNQIFLSDVLLHAGEDTTDDWSWTEVLLARAQTSSNPCLRVLSRALALRRSRLLVCWTILVNLVHESESMSRFLERHRGYHHSEVYTSAAASLEAMDQFYCLPAELKLSRPTDLETRTFVVNKCFPCFTELWISSKLYDFKNILELLVI